MAQALLTLQNVYKYYTGNQSVVMGLNNVNLTLHSGEFVAVTGESGSGKSTLAQVICGILPYESGEMRIGSQPTSHYDSSDWERHRREKISFISQNYGILPGSTVLTNVITALRIAGMDKKAAAAKAEALLRLVELWELRTRRAGKLSSGQKQRLSIARALAKPAPILVADEPTGNLDPENSAKVVKLLARAAQERLVILITHDFQEAEDYATRRIQLQDGQVVSDAALRPFVPCESRTSSTPAKKNLSLFVSRLQVSGRAVWSSLVMLFFTLTAFGVFAFLGTFLLNLDDTSVRIYDSSGFVNGDPKRIVVQRTDLKPLTPEDWDTILSVKYAESLERSGYLADISYAWQQDVDYELHYSVETRGDGKYKILTTSVELLRENTSFLQTVPMLPEGQEFLTGGRLPENLYEVVLAGDASRIGESFPVYLQNQNGWGADDYVRIDVTIVGVTDYGSGLFFHSDLGTAFTDYLLRGGWSAYLVFPVHGACVSMDADLFAEINDPLTGSTTWPESAVEYYTDENGEEFVRLFLPDEAFCTMSEDLYRQYLKFYSRLDSPVTVSLPTPDPQVYQYLTAVGYHDSTFIGYVQVDPAVFDAVVSPDNANQVSLSIEDYAYADRVLEDLQSMGYIAASPFQQGATEKDPELAAQRMQTLLVCLAALATVVLLMVLVLRELFGIQTESYKLLADMGLGCVTAKRSVLWQILGFAIAGQILSFAVIQLLAAMDIQRITALLRYLPVTNWLILSAVHFAVSLISGTLAIGSMKKKVYPQSGQRADLELGEEADA